MRFRDTMGSVRFTERKVRWIVAVRYAKLMYRRSETVIPLWIDVEETMEDGRIRQGFKTALRKAVSAFLSKYKCEY